MGRRQHNTKRWGRKANKQQQAKPKKGSGGAQTNVPATSPGKSTPLMAVAAAKQEAIAVLSKLAQMCWFGCMTKKATPATTVVVHGSASPSTASTMLASPAADKKNQETCTADVAVAAVAVPVATEVSTTAATRLTAYAIPSMSAPCRMESTPPPTPPSSRYAEVVQQVGMVLPWGKEAALALPQAARTVVAARIQQAAAWFYFENHGMTDLTRFHFQLCSWDFMIRMVVASLRLLQAAYVCALASVVAGVRTPNILLLNLYGDSTGSKLLPDLGHEKIGYILNKLGYTTDYINVHHLPDTILTLLASLLFALLVLHPLRCIVFRRVTEITSFLFWFRAITVTITSMPDPSPICLAQFGSPSGFYKTQEIFPRAFKRAAVYMFDPTNHITCGDMIFSGHTTVMMVICLVFYYYCRKELMGDNILFRKLGAPKSTCKAIRWSVYLTTAVGIEMVLATRLHYSIDVFLAIFFSLVAFIGYHVAVEYPRLKAGVGLVWAYLRWMEAEQLIAVERDAEVMKENQCEAVKAAITRVKLKMSEAEIEEFSRELMSAMTTGKA